MSDDSERIQADIRDASAALDAAEVVAPRGLELAPLERSALGRSAIALEALVRSTRTPLPDRIHLTLAQRVVLDGVAEPEKAGSTVRVTLWTILRRARVCRRVRAALVTAYNAAQHGREAWQINGKNERAILGDALLGADGAEESIEPGPEGIRAPAARILRIAGFEIA